MHKANIFYGYWVSELPPNMQHPSALSLIKAAACSKIALKTSCTKPAQHAQGKAKYEQVNKM